MARIYPGGVVLGKKPRPNPMTVSGHPQWNRYQGTDYRPCATEINRKLHKPRVTGPKHDPGRRSKVRGKRKLDPRNLCHRANPEQDYARGVLHNQFEAARVLSLKLDRLKGSGQYMDAWTSYRKIILSMKAEGHYTALRQLQDLEQARGQDRISCIIG